MPANYPLGPHPKKGELPTSLLIVYTEDWDRIDAMADKHNVTQAEIVRTLINYFEADDESNN